MTIKVIRGVGSEPVSSATNDARQMLKGAVAAPPGTVASSAPPSDASVVALRCNRCSAVSNDRIRDGKEAKNVARDVAERIEQDEEKLEAHGKLRHVNSHEHLAH